MSGEIEAAGAAVTAGLAAGAIEGREAHRVGDGAVCANCGAAVSDKFCQSCGQATHIHRSLSHIFEEFLHGIVHFDTKAWRTLPMLAFRPGTLTRNYIFGQRARYLSPIAVFLFTVFLMFFVFSLISAPVGQINEDGPSTITELKTRSTEIAADLKEAQDDLAEAQRETGPGAGGMLTGAQASLRGVEVIRDRNEQLLKAAVERDALYRRALEKVTAELATAKAANEITRADSLEITRSALEKAVAGDGAEQRALKITQDAAGDVNVSLSVKLSDSNSQQTIFDEIKRQEEMGRVTVNTGVPEWDKKIHEKLRNPELGWYKIQNAAYKFAFLLVPMSLPFLAFLFLFKRGITLYDHTVFLLYSLSFVSLLVIFGVVTSRIVPEAIFGPVAGWMLLAPIAHMFFQLKGAYALGWFSAAWRTVMLSVFAVICLSFFLIAIVLLGLVG